MGQGDYEQRILEAGWVDRRESNREGPVGVKRGSWQLASMKLGVGSGHSFHYVAVIKVPNK